ncbi:Ppx/GppA phosphatase family protein [Ferrimonas marina]|uniref:Exopolyphosphatase / guanosine-5'-triphosphate,3'-diphosphate pyrophosphatase n=1 Tax=Ferrimonas marina TaxID=299255 RepID=A0A1M5S9U5_9GAMM|nr:hypothetical protein [Ferrimonas marina]SHH35367.1 exopolyphosphatase / guanosine-5'-triphosphate,3'-diphosphate pyrophosphatase [Ferrimonas marina]
MSIEKARIGDTIAAIDLGSNSFHLAIARVLENRVQILHRIKQRVQLAEGMDRAGNLAESAMERGLDCLAQFAQHLQSSQINQVRVVATYALRRAPNRHKFVKRANKILGTQIDVIPGREEARLIYRGVALSRELDQGNLVIDIGGGSTELIIGQGTDPVLLESLDMGCVSYQDRFFDEGKLSAKRFQRAILAAQQQLEPLLERYRNQGWQHAIGCSGTIKALTLLCHGDTEASLSRDDLEQLRERIIDQGLSGKGFETMSEARLRVLPAGLSVLLACFRSLKIDQLQFCDSALREGVILEMSGEQAQSSVCAETVAAMERLHHVDTHHGQQVAATARGLFSQHPEQSPECLALLGWAARLHEVGLSLNFKGMHRHTGYILGNSNLPGFTVEQQQLLAFLGRYQRKRLDECQPLVLQLASGQVQLAMLLCLRLSVLWHLGRRHDIPVPLPTWATHSLTLALPESLVSDPLLRADLLQEQQYLEGLGWQLELQDEQGQVLTPLEP